MYETDKKYNFTYLEEQKAKNHNPEKLNLIYVP